MNALSLVHSDTSTATSVVPTEELVTFIVAGQHFGIAAREVQDVLRAQPLTRIPLARPEVAGALNLRGHIVTAINMRRRLNVASAEPGAKTMSVVVAVGEELFSLLVDGVGEVLSPAPADYEPAPPSLDSHWRELSRGIYRLSRGLLVVLDVARLVDFADVD